MKRRLALNMTLFIGLRKRKIILLKSDRIGLKGWNRNAYAGRREKINLSKFILETMFLFCFWWKASEFEYFVNHILRFD